jgi:hypothetical protein
VDDPAATSAGAYATYGITGGGAVVAVRPDGYIGCITTRDNVQKLGDYFAGFLQ